MTDTDELIDAYRSMRSIRAFEDCAATAYREGKLPGWLHLSTGGEASATGVIGQLLEEDRIYTSHRPNGHFLAAGVDPKLVMAELAGRETGLCAGRGGAAHLMSDRVVLATGIVGGQVPVAVGHAAAMQPGALVAVFFGDGSVQTGAWLEAINLAALWRVPLLMVCENNGWAEFTKRNEHTNVKDVRQFGQLHGLPSALVDGSDYVAVHDAAARLIQGVRAGGGPALLECTISRLRPHYEGDVHKPDANGRDPIQRMAGRLALAGVPASTIAEIDSKAVTDADRILDQAIGEPLADPARDADLVFARSLG